MRQRCSIPAFTAINAAIMIPSGLPNISPANSEPNLCGLHRQFNFHSRVKANGGVTTKAEKLCNACSSLRTGAVALALARSSANNASCCPLLVKTRNVPPFPCDRIRPARSVLVWRIPAR
jgi:hypothetical protein